jgi:ribosomal protein L11 methylase PrmA
MAAAAGAAAVTGVDSSASAVQLAQDNAELNGLTDRCACAVGGGTDRAGLTCQCCAACTGQCRNERPHRQVKRYVGGGGGTQHQLATS